MTLRGFCFALGLGTMLAGSSLGCGDAVAPPANYAGPQLPLGDDDGDGVLNNVDLCPGQKEDGLGAKPKDGCPNGS
jgi:hypothetical protein